MSDLKIAVVILETLENNNARVYRGLKTALEFKAAGDDVIVMFDGSGVETLAKIADASHPMHGLVTALGDTIIGACEFCSKSHNVFEPIRDGGFPLLSDNGGEASVRKLVVDGYQIMNY
ncbi:sulfur reduction protein DsrE [Salinibacterium sp. NG253]|uniref:sulfur reduction protein DsrE n=1 Tax=unclassified Salinibacterium TaxID=2632331 RepID=UPI0018CD527E|nr:MULTISPECIES: sulfur reduction protein DsrE [unclassified Salinibacterium]MBH0115313.1 sulfur reduction protein DsrE [Salinibacterium sp. NG253]MBH0128849.1 sulfur reduction protein DsrE [Salinibacterium sp. NK8237]